MVIGFQEVEPGQCSDNATEGCAGDGVQLAAEDTRNPGFHSCHCLHWVRGHL